MNILQIVSGGIAAYKAIDLTSQLVKQGHNVKVILTIRYGTSISNIN